MEYNYYVKAADYEGNTVCYLPEGKIRTMDLCPDERHDSKRVNSIIRSFSKCTSFKIDNAFFNMPYMREIIWENRVKSYESHIRGYMNAYGRKLTNDEAILFALSQLLLHRIGKSNMPRQLTSTEYKMYRNAMAWFCGDKNKQPKEPEKYFHINDKKENRHDRRMRKMRRTV